MTDVTLTRKITQALASGFAGGQETRRRVGKSGRIYTYARFE
jgi:hypothetical protein